MEFHLPRLTIPCGEWLNSMTDLLSTNELLQHLIQADKLVRILGVVPFDLPWEDLLPQWFNSTRPDNGLRVEVLCESDNMLFAKALTSDTDEVRDRKSFRQLKFVRDRALELPALLSELSPRT